MEPRTHSMLARMLRETSTSRTGRLNTTVHKQVLQQFYNEGPSLAQDQRQEQEMQVSIHQRARKLNQGKQAYLKFVNDLMVRNATKKTKDSYVAQRNDGLVSLPEYLSNLTQKYRQAKVSTYQSAEMKAHSFDNQAQLDHFKNQKARQISIKKRFEPDPSDIFAKTEYEVEDEIDLKFPKLESPKIVEIETLDDISFDKLDRYKKKRNPSSFVFSYVSREKREYLEKKMQTLLPGVGRYNPKHQFTEPSPTRVGIQPCNKKNTCTSPHVFIKKNKASLSPTRLGQVSKSTLGAQSRNLLPDISKRQPRLASYLKKPSPSLTPYIKTGFDGPEEDEIVQVVIKTEQL